MRECNALVTDAVAAFDAASHQLRGAVSDNAVRLRVENVCGLLVALAPALGRLAATVQECDSWLLHHGSRVDRTPLQTGYAAQLLHGAAEALYSAQDLLDQSAPELGALREPDQPL